MISSIIGIEHRSTMDLDTTLRDYPLTEADIVKAFRTICDVQVDDGITYTFRSITPIRDDDEYGGYKVSFTAIYGKIKAPVSMDVSTGDIITPEASKHMFSDMFDSTIAFELWSYPIETILSEKIETILSRGVNNTRPRDFYDVYMLSGYEFDKKSFSDAFMATATHRESIDKIRDYNEILQKISTSPEMNVRWKNYKRDMPYAEGITFEETITAIRKILSI